MIRDEPKAPASADDAVAVRGGRARGAGVAGPAVASPVATTPDGRRRGPPSGGIAGGRLDG